MHRFYRRFFRKKSTPEARALKAALEGRDLHVVSEVWDGHKHIDLGIPAARINIEVDGKQHLTSSRQILADLKRGHYSDNLGYDTIHIHNEEIHSDLHKIADAIAEAAKIRAKIIEENGTTSLYNSH